jgi:choline dehydrogenase-like flavoprotein
MNKRLLFPQNPALETNIIMEQESLSLNKIFLSSTEKDLYGQPIASIEWSASEKDAENIFKAADCLEDFWNKSDLNEYGIFKMKSKSEIEKLIKKADGIHHPSGSTRMANTKEDGVVDKDLNVFSIDNLKILSTSVFPSGGGANPTMTLMMFGLRYVDQFLNR